jgi:membrane protein DedA with SNARE-associated domain
MFDWILSIIDKAGYVGISLLMMLENLFPPIPSELIMPMGGFLTEKGELSLAGVILAGTLGSFVGQVGLYFLGRSLGERRLKRLAQKHGRWVAVSPDEIDKAKAFLSKRRGGLAIMLGRLVPGIRSLISIPAGITRMPLSKFLPCTLAGTALWTAALAYAGVLVGNNYAVVERYLNPVSYVIVFLVVVSYLRRVLKGSPHWSPAKPSLLTATGRVPPSTTGVG